MSPPTLSRDAPNVYALLGRGSLVSHATMLATNALLGQEGLELPLVALFTTGYILRSRKSKAERNAHRKMGRHSTKLKPQLGWSLGLP